MVKYRAAWPSDCSLVLPLSAAFPTPGCSPNCAVVSGKGLANGLLAELKQMNAVAPLASNARLRLESIPVLKVGKGADGDRPKKRQRVESEDEEEKNEEEQEKERQRERIKKNKTACKPIARPGGR